MLVVPIHKLVEGDTLSRGLFSSDGRLMLKRGVPLNSRLIDGIKRLDCRYLFVESTEYRKRLGSTDPTRYLPDLTHYVLQQVIQSILNSSAFPIRLLTEWADYAAFAVSGQNAPGIRDLAARGAELETRSLTVCFISLLTAKALGKSKNVLEKIAMGSLLHDIGLHLPHDDSPRQHPIVGYNILSKQKGIPEEALNIVLQHHEQVDGCGYPNGVRGGQLSENAQICGLAGIFADFLTGGKTSRQASEGFGEIVSNINTAYSRAVIDGLLAAFRHEPAGIPVGQKPVSRAALLPDDHQTKRQLSI